MVYDFETVAAARVLARVLGAVPVQACPSHAANEKFSLRAQMWDPGHPLMAEGAQVIIGFMGEHGIGLDEMGRYGAEWDTRNLVFLPRAFQIEGDSFDDRFAFVGPTFGEPEPGLWSPPGDGRRVALVSLGTEAGDRGDFFRLCAEAFPLGRLARRHDPRPGQRPRTARPAVGPRRSAPLAAAPAVLPHADVFVCHAGMGSLMESLSYGTPVVALPTAHELVLSARRLEECGVGRALDRSALTAERLARHGGASARRPRHTGCPRRPARRHPHRGRRPSRRRPAGDVGHAGPGGARGRLSVRQHVRRGGSRHRPVPGPTRRRPAGLSAAGSRTP
ncbi:nucleotide disphospho-sugar-binding domain-containing protein [Streptomyces lasalocidi]